LLAGGHGVVIGVSSWLDFDAVMGFANLTGDPITA
jgi:hypothetical protein